MAGKLKPVSQVKQILRLHLQGKGKKTIARDMSISKNTVKEYITLPKPPFERNICLPTISITKSEALLKKILFD